MVQRIEHQPDFAQFERALLRKERPAHLPFYEHIASGGFIGRRTETDFARMSPTEDAYWATYVDFWMGMGYDEVPMEIPPNYPMVRHENVSGKYSHGSESSVMFSTLEEYAGYAWPSEDAVMDYGHFERAAARLPEGAKIVGGVCAGPYEWATYLMGVEGLSLAIYIQPDLVRDVFDRIGYLHTTALRNIASMDFVGALRQGDDLGFKTSTFLPPEELRKYVFPIYKQMADIAHEHGKPFILHSCGNLSEVYDDIIDGCGIDAKHSFEDVIMPVPNFKAQYGQRVTPLGGLDVDFICRANEDELRAYTRRMVEACYEDGFWALGTGNSLTDYMPVENYMIVLDEGSKIGR